MITGNWREFAAEFQWNCTRSKLLIFEFILLFTRFKDDLLIDARSTNKNNKEILNKKMLVEFANNFQNVHLKRLNQEHLNIFIKRDS